MGLVIVERTRCDFCGCGGAWTRPGDFIRYRAQGVDLCKWCATSAKNVRWTECGGHRVTFSARGRGAGWDWSCSCGATLRSEYGGFPSFLTTVPENRFSMMGAFRIVHWLAQLHTEGHGWDRDAGFGWPGWPGA